MASKPPASTAKRPAPRLYVVTPPIEVVDAFAHALAAALAGADVAAVLLRLAQRDERGRINAAKVLASRVQPLGVALLLDGDAELVARAGADGAHVTGIDALRAALPTLKPDRIAGVGGLASRHDAMLAGEVGADYVMFGEPDARGERPRFDHITERVAWWAEVFEPPCVAFAASGEEVEPLAAAGADFVALGDWIWGDSRGAAAAVADAARQLSPAEAVE